MKTKFNEFINEELRQPITIRSNRNNLFYYKIFFDEKGRVDKIDNQWDVKLPVWYGYDLDINTLENYLRKKEPGFYIEK